MAKYAQYTKVPVNKTKMDIQKLLENWGIEEFFFGTSPRGDGIGFKYEGRVYKRNVTMPEKRWDTSNAKYERLVRQRWRILYMSLKMKLEEISDGGVSFEDQFLSMLCLPDGTTMSNFIKLPENKALLEKSEMPKMLTG